MNDNPFAAPQDVTGSSPVDGSGRVATDEVANAPTAPHAATPSETSAGQSPVNIPDNPVLHEPAPWPPTDEPPASPPPAPTRSIRKRTIALIAAGALILGAAGGFGAAALYDSGNGPSAESPAALPVSNTTGTMSRPDGSVASIAAAVLPSVVSIEAKSSAGRTATGSGFVIRSDGYIVTNNHVVEGANGNVAVLMSDGTVLDGTVVGTTTVYDLAVVKINKTGLKPLVLGDSSKVVVGDPVIAVGSPLGLDSTVTSGIVSALHRPVTTGSSSQAASSFIDAIQTDAAINPGNSGGPLINANGEVIGINSAIASLPGATQATGAGSVGLGFAIPSNQVRRTVDQLITTGTATYPVIGVVLDGTNQGQGVLVATSVNGQPGVVPGSPADKAGIKAGDVITQIDGRPVSRDQDLVVAIRAKAPGDQVTFTILRGGKQMKITVTLASNKDVNFGNVGNQ